MTTGPNLSTSLVWPVDVSVRNAFDPAFLLVGTIVWALLGASVGYAVGRLDAALKAGRALGGSR